MNNAPKFFDEDGDPVMELSNAIYDVEHYVHHWVKHFAGKGMSRLELRAMIERMTDAVQMAGLSYIHHMPKSEGPES